MIPYYKPWTSGEELQHIAQAMENQGSSNARHYTESCERWLEDYTGCQKAFLTPSCTAALEMAAILANIQPGDEVIMSSFTFSGMANAFVVKGGVPVFVDIRADTLNIDECMIEAAITSRTRAIVVMHYGGVACEMDSIMMLAQKHDLLVIEDAAHAIGASYKGRPLGSIGHLAAFSFHQTKNIQCGEGGALVINDKRLTERAVIVRENGTDKTDFLRKKASKYTWLDIGSSFILSEFSAAFLWAQIQKLDFILEQRKLLWRLYQQHLLPKDAQAVITHNAHIFYITTNSSEQRQSLIDQLLKAGIQGTSHYQPLHTSAAGRRFGKAPCPLPHTETMAATLLRLPLWIGLSTKDAEHICKLLSQKNTKSTYQTSKNNSHNEPWKRPLLQKQNMPPPSEHQK